MTAVLASVLTGLFTLAAAGITLFLQERHQLAMAREERLWSRQAETYVALLQYQGSGMIEGYGGSAEELAIRDELTAKATAFASDVVLKLWQQSALASLALNHYVSEEWPQWSTPDFLERLDIEEEMKEDLDLRRLRQDSSDAGKRLAGRIRAELGSARRLINAPVPGAFQAEGQGQTRRPLFPRGLRPPDPRT